MDPNRSWGGLWAGIAERISRRRVISTSALEWLRNKTQCSAHTQKHTQKNRTATVCGQDCVHPLSVHAFAPSHRRRITRNSWQTIWSDARRTARHSQAPAVRQNVRAPFERPVGALFMRAMFTLYISGRTAFQSTHAHARTHIIIIFTRCGAWVMMCVPEHADTDALLLARPKVKKKCAHFPCKHDGAKSSRS